MPQTTFQAIEAAHPAKDVQGAPHKVFDGCRMASITDFAF
jgi:hypothetical protein